jgi:hypothetical protein
MRSQPVSIPYLVPSYHLAASAVAAAVPALFSLLAAGCAGGAGAREHDAMVAALRGVDRDRPAAAPGELALDAGALDRAQLVAAVLARNPELDVARDTWRAAVAAHPSAIAFADPMVTYEVAPFSVAGDVPFGQRVQLAIDRLSGRIAGGGR